MLYCSSQPDNETYVGIAEQLINDYWALLNAENADGGAGAGDGVKLLNAFNGLFKGLEDALHDLLMTFQALDVPDAWKDDVDLVSQAAHLAVSSLFCCYLPFFVHFVFPNLESVSYLQLSSSFLLPCFHLLHYRWNNLIFIQM